MASDFHTHIPHPGKRELLNNGRGRGPLWSLSFHPWDTKELPPLSFEEIKECAALGEMGFDRYKSSDVSQDQQLKIFRFLLEKAADFRKPVVLHWVGGYDKLFQLTAPFKEVNFLFHGYAKESSGLLEELLRRNFYVSLSPRIITAGAVREFLKQNPGSRVGVESDDNENAEIEKLYDLINIPGFEEAADEHFGAFLNL